MSLECSDCERDLRGPHDDDCPRVRKAVKAFGVWYADDDVPFDVPLKDAFIAGFQAAERAARKRRRK